MDAETLKIGLSLGADLCWPAAYEELLRRLDLNLQVGDRQVRFATERVPLEPFDLRAPKRYDLVLDRLTHWFHLRREWIKKAVLLDGTYVLNNPWSLQSMEKHTSYCAMIRLGMRIPETWMIPSKEQVEAADMAVTVQRYGKLFSLAEVGDQVGWPAFLKPYDGGGWVGVSRVTEPESLHKAYDASGSRVNHLQQSVPDWDLFVRAVGIGPQVNVIRYDPDQPLHDRYRVDFHFMNGEDWKKAQQTTRVINAFFGWDFNSCEMLRSAGQLNPIDFANPCPDSQVTSLHFHFPWLVKSLLRWTVFCAATGRPFRQNLNWQPYFDIADEPGSSYDEKLGRYDALAAAHFDDQRFAEFCEEHFSELDTLAVQYFDSPEFKQVVRAKVAALFPPHEVEKFTEHFFGMVRFWCHTERERMARDTP